MVISLWHLAASREISRRNVADILRSEDEQRKNTMSSSIIDVLSIFYHIEIYKSFFSQSFHLLNLFDSFMPIIYCGQLHC